MAKAIVLVGGEGCGKTTLMVALREVASFLMVEMSDLIREKSKIDSDFGAAAREAAENGHYLSCELMKPLFLNHMVDVSPTQNIILGGCTRRRSQAEYVLAHLNQMGYDTHVVYLYMTEENCKKRISDRVEQAVREGKKPRPRDLDPEAVQMSLDSFFGEIAGITDYFESQEIPVHGVSATLTKEEVFGLVCKRTGVKIMTSVSV